VVKEQVDYRQYLDAVVRCMTNRLHLDASEIDKHLREDESYIHDLFAEDPEIIFHDDPIRLATSLGVRWRLMERPQLVVKRPH
jgi:hypothetical protein